MVTIFEYIDHRGKGVLTDWHLDAAVRGKLEDKLDLLETSGPDLPPNLLASLGSNIWKLKVHGKVQLRPHLCFGPVTEDDEVTFLAQAIEKDWKLDPWNVFDLAKQRRGEVIEDPEHMRRER